MVLFLIKVSHSFNRVPARAMTTAVIETSLLHEQENKKYASAIKRNEAFLKDLGVKEDNGMWIFGYGSLVWKVGFQFDQKTKGYIKGFVRRFWQLSTDHRGIPEKPGRVVTLIKSKNPEQELWGFAYHVPMEHMDKTIELLNFREKGGYNLHKVKLYTDSEERQRTIDVLFYMGDDESAREIPLDELASIIAFSVGPSGTNKEYLFNLAKALRQEDMASADDKLNILYLEEKVKEILANNIVAS